MDRRLQEENEKKKEYLKSYQRAVKRERDILEEIKRLRADKMFPSVVNDGMPKGSSQSDLSDYIAILDEQIEILKKERLNKVQKYRKIESQIRKMHSEDERKVLRLRYIKGLKWDDVATEMGYGWTQVHRLHSSALKNFKMVSNGILDSCYNYNRFRWMNQISIGCTLTCQALWLGRYIGT